MMCAMFGFIRVYRHMKSMRAPQKLPCECVRGKKVGFEELDEKELAPKRLGWGCVVGVGFKEETGSHPHEFNFTNNFLFVIALRIGGDFSFFLNK